MKKNVVLIGAGVMSATLAVLLKELAPDWNINVFEKLSRPAEESSNEWNNAGTGHAALCELNYTSEKPDGTIDIEKAVKVNEQFQVSLQFWSHLVRSGVIKNPGDFIKRIPHMSFVQGVDDVQFLKKRFEALENHPLFNEMEYSENHDVLSSWFPLMMEGRGLGESIAATRVESGSDVNFGSLTRMLFDYLKNENVKIRYDRDVKDIRLGKDGTWKLSVDHLENGNSESYSADFVFIGAGGGSLHLLQKTGIEETRGLGGFPVSGLFMICNNPEVINAHHAKVYGKAKVGAPPMSVPHLDTRFIDGKKSLLFGPFAGFTPKFLKNGSMLDLISSIKPYNASTMLISGAKNIPLTKYLIQQVLLSKEERMNELREFIPNAKEEDWEMITAGQRVQVIKDTVNERGVLQFGTEVITSSDGTVAALLGASPGASTAVHVMFDVLEKCFPDEMKEWSPKIKEMIPSFGVKLSEHAELLHQIKASYKKHLRLEKE